MTSALFIVAVLAVFAIFGGALGYANIATHGLHAPGARPLD